MRPHLLLAATCLAIAMPALADELPQRKPGLWSISMEINGRHSPMPGIEQCTDRETDRLMQSNMTGQMGAVCSKKEIVRNGDTITIDSECKIGPRVTASHVVVKGDFNSEYTLTTTSRHISGPTLPHMPANGETQVSMTAKWVGPCKKGQKPGDIIMPGGISINVLNLKLPPH